MASDEETRNTIAALTGATFSINDTRAQIPKSGGLYAWWIVGSALPGVPASKHPSEPGVDLLYVGIAPKGPASAATLRSRVLGNHLNGNIAASTLRRTLASLLVGELSLTPNKRGEKLILPPPQNAKLSAWQKTYLRMTWHATAQPWLIEAAVIKTLRPPLNLADNDDHPFHSTVSAARKALRRAADR